MIIKLTRNITCSDSEACSKNIQDKIIAQNSGLVLEATSKTSEVNGHVSILHEQNNHTIWVHIYDNDGIHESERDGAAILQRSDRAKKFTGTFPTKQSIEGAI